MSSNRQLFFEHLAQTSDFPMALEISHAEGNFLIDVKGKKYLDLISGISVSNLGHNHPAIKAAIHYQLNKNMHLMVYGEFIQSVQVELAAALAAELPEKLDSVYFVNSGSEAIEGALKLAKRYTQRTEIISFNKSYHGSTHGALSLGGTEEWKNAFRPLLPDMLRLDYNDFSALGNITRKTACVIIEPIQAEAGVRESAPGYLQAVRKKCDETGALLVFDEIQTGFGRLGSLYYFQQLNIVPDILVTGKAMGGGMPLGAFISSVKIMKCLRNNPVLGHITTFGGHPVCCAASMAALKEILQSGLMPEVSGKELLFKKLLVHPQIKEVRGKGLMLAVELKDFEYVQKVIQKCIQNGLITDWFLYCDNSLRIAPPLTISQEEIKLACNIILSALD